MTDKVRDRDQRIQNRRADNFKSRTARGTENRIDLLRSLRSDAREERLNNMRRVSTIYTRQPMTNVMGQTSSSSNALSEIDESADAMSALESAETFKTVCWNHMRQLLRALVACDLLPDKDPIPHELNVLLAEWDGLLEQSSKLKRRYYSWWRTQMIEINQAQMIPGVIRKLISFSDRSPTLINSLTIFLSDDDNDELKHELVKLQLIEMLMQRSFTFGSVLGVLREVADRSCIIRNRLLELGGLEFVHIHLKGEGVAPPPNSRASSHEEEPLETPWNHLCTLYQILSNAIREHIMQLTSQWKTTLQTCNTESATVESNTLHVRNVITFLQKHMVWWEACGSTIRAKLQLRFKEFYPNVPAVPAGPSSMITQYRLMLHTSGASLATPLLDEERRWAEQHGSSWKGARNQVMITHQDAFDNLCSSYELMARTLDASCIDTWKEHAIDVLIPDAMKMVDGQRSKTASLFMDDEFIVWMIAGLQCLDVRHSTGLFDITFFWSGMDADDSIHRVFYTLATNALARPHHLISYAFLYDTGYAQSLLPWIMQMAQAVKNEETSGDRLKTRIQALNNFLVDNEQLPEHVARFKCELLKYEDATHESWFGQLMSLCGFRDNIRLEVMYIVVNVFLDASLKYDDRDACDPARRWVLQFDKSQRFMHIHDKVWAWIFQIASAYMTNLKTSAATWTAKDKCALVESWFNVLFGTFLRPECSQEHAHEMREYIQTIGLADDLDTFFASHAPYVEQQWFENARVQFDMLLGDNPENDDEIVPHEDYKTNDDGGQQQQSGFFQQQQQQQQQQQSTAPAFAFGSTLQNGTNLFRF